MTVEPKRTSNDPVMIYFFLSPKPLCIFNQDFDGQKAIFQAWHPNCRIGRSLATQFPLEVSVMSDTVWQSLQLSINISHTQSCATSTGCLASPVLSKKRAIYLGCQAKSGSHLHNNLCVWRNLFWTFPLCWRRWPNSFSLKREKEEESMSVLVCHKILKKSELGGKSPFGPLCVIHCISEGMPAWLLEGKGVDRPFSRRTEAAQRDPRRNLFTCGATNNCGVYTPKDCFPFQAAVQQKQAKEEGVAKSRLML